MRDAAQRRAVLHLEDDARERRVRFTGARRERGEQVEQLRHALALQRRARYVWNQFFRIKAFEQQRGELLVGEALRALIEIFFERSVVVLGERLGQRGAVVQRHARGPAPRQLRQLREDGIDIRALAVRLVDEKQRGNPHLRQRAPYNLGLRLHALDRGDGDGGEIHSARRALRLAGKIAVARRVDDVDFRAVPRKEGRGRAHGNPAPPLELREVRVRGAVVYAAQRTHRSGLKEHLLRQRRLARVDVREHAYRQRAARNFIQSSQPLPRGAARRGARVSAPHTPSSARRRRARPRRCRDIRAAP